MKKNKKKLKSYFPRPNTTEYKKKKIWDAIIRSGSLAASVAKTKVKKWLTHEKIHFIHLKNIFRSFKLMRKVSK